MSDELAALDNVIALYTRVRSPRVRAHPEQLMDELTDMVREGRSFRKVTDHDGRGGGSTSR